MRAKTFDVVSEGRRTHGQDEVVPGQALHDAFTHRGQEAGEERVVFREAATPRHRRHEHASLVAFGQGNRFVPRAIAVDRRTDDKRRALGRVERLAHLRQQIGLRAQFGTDGTRQHGFGHHRPIVGRDRHQHRPAWRQHCDVVGACDGQGHVLGTRGLHAPLHIGLGQLNGLGRMQEGVERQDAARLLPGRDDHRRAVLEGREDVAHRMAHPSGRMQVHETGVARGLGVAIGHTHHHGFLQTQHVAEVGREIQEQRQLGGTRVAEDSGDAEAAQQVEHRLPHADQVLVVQRGHARLLQPYEAAQYRQCRFIRP